MSQNKDMRHEVEDTWAKYGHKEDQGTLHSGFPCVGTGPGLEELIVQSTGRGQSCFPCPPREIVLWEESEWNWNLHKSSFPAVNIVPEPFTQVLHLWI